MGIPQSPFSQGGTPSDFGIDLDENCTPGFPGNLNPVTGFPTVNQIGSNPVGPVLPGNNPIDPSIAGSFMSGWTYLGVPYTGDSSRTITPIGTPTWFTKSSLNRAKWVREGPYTDPQGLFLVPAGYALVSWEIKQGTPQWQPPADELIPTIFAILEIDLNFVNPPGSNSPPLLYQYVNPDLTFAMPGDDTAVWFSIAAPAHVIGMFRIPDDVNSGFGRDNSGSMGIR